MGFGVFGPRGPARRLPVLVSMLGALALCAGQSGCVQRRMLIRSNPPGALVYVDDYEIGTTPISTSFVYYGTRKIRLVKDGYETLTVMQSIPAPWYEIPPVDFVSENLIPGELRDYRTFDYQLRPQMVVPTEQLLGRAESLRRGVLPPGSPPARAPVPTIRVNPAPALPGTAPGFAPAPGGPEVLPTPAGVGGQPVYPLPPR